MTSRAVHLVTRLNVGGIARFLLTAQDVVGLLLRGRVEPGEREAAWGGPQAVVPSLHRSPQPLDDTRALAEIVARLRRLRPALLHTHASKAGALGRVAASFLGVPAVHTFHGHVLEGYFSSAASALFTGVERALARRARLTATGPATARALSERLGAPVEVIPPGVTLPPAAPGARERWRASLGSPERIALAVGRGASVKDLPRFVAAARAAGYLPVVAGTDRAPGAVALGCVEEMQDLYAAVDVVVSASRREGTPYALLEAAFSGVPVVATPVGDVPWIVGEGGILTEDLQDALVRLHDPWLRQRLGLLAGVSVRRRFPASALPLRLRDLYGNVAQAV